MSGRVPALAARMRKTHPVCPADAAGPPSLAFFWSDVRALKSEELDTLGVSDEALAKKEGPRRIAEALKILYGDGYHTKTHIEGFINAQDTPYRRTLRLSIVTSYPNSDTSHPCR